MSKAAAISSRLRSSASRKASSASSKASPAARSVSGASSTRNLGSMPTATGWAESRRLQKPWIVVTQALPRRGSRPRGRTGPPPAPRPLSAPVPCRTPAGALSGEGEGGGGGGGGAPPPTRRAEGEGEDGVGRGAPLADRRAVAVAHHPGLAGAGARLDHDLGGRRLDRGSLLGGWPALAHRSSSSSSLSGSTGARSRRQIGAKS